MAKSIARYISRHLLLILRAALRNLSTVTEPESQDETARYRRTILTFWLVGALPWPLIFALIYKLMLDSPEGAWICLACFAGFLPVPVLMRGTWSVRLAGNWLVGVMISALIALGYITGGSGSPPLVWLLAVPLIAIHVAGLRSAVIWCGLALGALVVFELLYQNNVILPVRLSHPHMHDLELMGNVGVVLLIATLAGTYDAQRRAATRLAHARQVNLHEALDRAKDHAAQLAASSAAQEESESLYRNLVQNSPMGMLFYELGDNDELVLAGANPAVDRLIGVDVQRLIGKRAEEAFPALRDTGLLDRYRDAARDGVAWSTDRIEYDDGSVSGVFELRVSPTSPNKMVVVFMNITDRVKAEATLRASEREIAMQAGKAEVATDVLHNVGNALSRVKVSTSLMREKLRNSETPTLKLVAGVFDEHKQDLAGFLTQDERGRDMPGFLEQLSELMATEQSILESELNGLTDSVDYIAHIISAQQVHSKGQNQAEVVRPSEIVEQAIKMSLGDAGQSSVEVRREMEAIPAASLHRHKVVQILVNLLNNARQAAVGVEQPHVTCGVRRIVGDEGDRVQFTVTDNGIGIDAENLNKLFTFGFTTRSDGHGFGLHSAANLAQEMGGSLTATSEGRGKGATFTLELPLEKERVLS